MVLTRSMVLAEAHRIDTLKAPFKISVLTTPGIATIIASKLPLADKGVVGLFSMVNDSQLRHELQPFVDTVAATHADNHYKKKTNHMIQILMRFLKRTEDTNGSENKSKVVLEMFDYLCTLHEDIFLLGKIFSQTLDVKLDELEEECVHNQLYDMIPELDIFRNQLSKYIDWGKHEE